MIGMKTAFITGITGQDGSYLAEFLLGKGYEVHGLTRQFSGRAEVALPRLRHVLDKINLHIGDLSDQMVARELVEHIKPDEVYHLATKHEVGITVDEYIATRSIDVDATLYFLGAIAELRPKCRFFYASSSNVFGSPSSSPQNEKTIFNPHSIYGISKVSSMHLVRMFRSKRQLFACSGILYNHESPRRDLFFLPRKITSTAAKIKLGLEKVLVLGELDARRDWGYAGDFVEAMWLMLQADKPQDYVIGTGETYSVRDLLDIVVGYLGMDWAQYVKVDGALIRPKGSIEIVADISEIQRDLGWAPKTKLEDMMKMMVQEDIKLSQI